MRVLLLGYITKSMSLYKQNVLSFVVNVTFLFYLFQVSYLAIDSLFPEWKIWTQFLDESTDGLRLDGLEESHPIEVTKTSIYVCMWQWLIQLYHIMKMSSGGG